MDLDACLSSSKGGTIQIYNGQSVLAEPFLDIDARVQSGGERGLFSMAFHPNYAENGRFYVNYSDNSGDTVVSEFSVSADPDLADPASEREILNIEQPFGNHNGGQLQFGPDGFLYVGMGDGGSGGDPQEHGQDLSTLLGALLRIDIDGQAPYQVPADNPFVGVQGAAPEIWAYGLRNPWRFSFDRESGELFAADVGQNSVEEVDLIVRGGNYGWNTMEGSECFDPPQGCNQTGLSLPIAEYTHALGVSVTGGYVYRGEQFPDLYGKYIFADYVSSRFWVLTPDGQGQWEMEEVLRPGFFISSFGEDEDGELYVIDYGGRVLHIQDASN